MKRTRFGIGLIVLATVLAALPGGASAQVAGIPNNPPPNPPAITRIPVVKPNFSVKITPKLPNERDAPVELESSIEPVAVPATPAVRTPTAKKPAEILVTGIPLPPGRPILTLGRPALLDAPHVPNMVTLLVQGDPESIGEDYDLTIVARTHLAMLDAELIKMRIGDDGALSDIVKQLIADDRVIGAQPDYLFELQQNETAALPASTLAGLQYAPKKMGVDTAHGLTRGENAIIAVIDTGIDSSHAVFGSAQLQAFDAVGTPSATPEPHGTAIAGLIAAGQDFVGIAPAANILVVRAFAQDEEGRFTSDSYVVAKAIDWAVGQGAQVLNMSFAGPGDPLILKMMDLLSERGVLVVAAAGNSGAGAPAAYPAAHPHAIAVTATDVSDGLYANANRGSYVTIAAPGVDVIAPAPNNGYEMVSGTSIATAHMSGILALMLSESATLNRDDVVSLLQQTSEDKGAPGQDPEFGLGLVNAFKATTALKDAG